MDKIEERQSPNADLYTDVHGHVAVTVRDEDAEVLEQDGQLNEEDRRRVNDCGNINPLQQFSVAVDSDEGI